MFHDLKELLSIVNAQSIEYAGRAKIRRQERQDASAAYEARELKRGKIEVRASLMEYKFGGKHGVNRECRRCHRQNGRADTCRCPDCGRLGGDDAGCRCERYGQFRDEHADACICPECCIFDKANPATTSRTL